MTNYDLSLFCLCISINFVLCRKLHNVDCVMELDGDYCSLINYAQYQFFIPLCILSICPLFSSEPHRNLIGISSEPHRNLIGTSSEPHWNLTESLPIDHRIFNGTSSFQFVFQFATIIEQKTFLLCDTAE